MIVLLLIAPHLARPLCPGAFVLHAALQTAGFALAAIAAIVIWFRLRPPLRPSRPVVAVAVAFVASAPSYAWLPFREMPGSYAQSLLQYALYPLLLGVLVSALASQRRIIHTLCIVLVSYAVLTALCIVVGVALGHAARGGPYHGAANREARALAFGALAALTLTATARAGRPVARLGPWPVAPAHLGFPLAALLALAMLPCFARGDTAALVCALVTCVAAWRWRPRAAAALVGVALAGSVVYPVAVWSGWITPSRVDWIRAVVPGKWDADDQPGRFTASRRVNMLRAFLSGITPADALGTRPELHQYARYHAQDVRTHVRTPHNYWASLLLTAGYVPALCVLGLWCSLIYVIAQSPTAVARWLPPWLVFLAVQGLAGRGAWNDLGALVFWCIVASALAPADPPEQPTCSSGQPDAGADEERATHVHDGDT